MDVKDFYYDLPQELIAQDPLEDRSSSRLMVLDKITGEVEHRHFKDITECEQAWANGYVYTRKFPNGHTAVLPKPPIQFQDKDTVPQAAPLLGEHMRDILLEYGYTEAEIEALIKEHVVHA